MTQRECYALMGANYEEILLRLKTEERIDKYLNMFLQDESLEQLEHLLSEEKFKEAFIIVHTLKSVTANLAFTELTAITAKVTDQLRQPETYTKAASMLPELKDSYEKAKSAIRQYKENKPEAHV